MTRIIAVANQKGGVGKTTSTVNIAAALALAGARVLVVDLDPQGNASTAIGLDHTEGTPGIYEALGGELTLSEVVRPCPDIDGLFGAPATIDLAGAPNRPSMSGQGRTTSARVSSPPRAS